MGGAHCRRAWTGTFPLPGDTQDQRQAHEFPKSLRIGSHGTLVVDKELVVYKLVRDMLRVCRAGKRPRCGLVDSDTCTSIATLLPYCRCGEILR